jgi:hypothetical protein
MIAGAHPTYVQGLQPQPGGSVLAMLVVLYRSAAAGLSWALRMRLDGHSDDLRRIR